MKLYCTLIIYIWFLHSDVHDCHGQKFTDTYSKTAFLSIYFANNQTAKCDSFYIKCEGVCKSTVKCLILMCYNLSFVWSFFIVAAEIVVLTAIFMSTLLNTIISIVTTYTGICIVNAPPSQIKQVYSFVDMII